MTQTVRVSDTRTTPAPPAAPRHARRYPDRPPTARPRTLSWPLATICLGLPAWWLLGFPSTILVFMALPMAWQLRKRGNVLAPKGFGWWLLFLAVVGLSALTLFADAPGAVSGGGLGRVASWAVFASYYVAATVVLLWVGNLDETVLPARTVLRLIGWLYVISTAGGWLGLLFPRLHLVSALELALPNSLRYDTLVQDLAHPVTAQVQDFLGYSAARPAAPFPFTNAWGANTAIFLPFFVVGWLARGNGWRRPVGLAVLVASTVPIVYSLNRGMWIGILFAAALATGRLALMGRFGALITMIAGVALIAVGVLATPLGGKIVERIQHPHSNTRRSDLATSAVSSALGSPVVGYGSTRPVQGNFTSLAAGASEDCPRCAVPPFGTHGHLYRLIFTEGFLGAVLYFGFFAVRLFRHARSRDPAVMAAWIAAATSVLFSLYYNLLPHALYVVMAGLGLAWRLDRQARAPEQPAPDEPARRSDPLPVHAPAVAVGPAIADGDDGGTPQPAGDPS